MQFQVPQFIEVEDRIFGPLTFKQFLYIAGGAGICYLLWRFLPIYIAVPLMLGTASLSAALAFFEWNGRPFIIAIEHGFFFFLNPKLYLWNNEQKPVEVKQHLAEAAKSSEVYIPRLSESKLHDLAWSLDIKERIDKEEENRDRRLDMLSGIRTARTALPQR